MSQDLVTMRQVVGESSGYSVLLGHVGMVSSVLVLFCNYINRKGSDGKNVFHVSAFLSGHCSDQK